MVTNRQRLRRPNGSREFPVRSVRVSDETWERARRRAAYEGHTMSAVMLAMIEGYGAGMVNMPKVEVVYRQPVTASMQD